MWRSSKQLEQRCKADLTRCPKLLPPTEREPCEEVDGDHHHGRSADRPTNANIVSGQAALTWAPADR